MALARAWAEEDDEDVFDSETEAEEKCGKGALRDCAG